MGISSIDIPRRLASYHATLAPRQLRTKGASKLASLRDPFAQTPTRLETLKTAFAAHTLFSAACIQKPITLGWCESLAVPRDPKARGKTHPFVQAWAELGISVGLGGLLLMRGALTGLWVLCSLFYITFQACRTLTQFNPQAFQMRLKTPDLVDLDAQLPQTPPPAPASSPGRMPQQFVVDMKRNQQVYITRDQTSVRLPADPSDSYAQILALCEANETWAYAVASVVNQSLMAHILTGLFPNFEVQDPRFVAPEHFVQFQGQPACIYYNQLQWSFHLSKSSDASVLVRLEGASMSGTPLMVAKDTRGKNIDVTTDAESNLMLEAVMQIAKPSARDASPPPICTQALRVRLLDRQSQLAMGAHCVESSGPHAPAFGEPTPGSHEVLAR